MKKTITYLSMAAAVLFIYSCSKSDSTPTPTTPTTHTFIVGGVTYTQNAIADSVGSSTGVSNDIYLLAASGLTSDKTGKGFIELVFSGGKKPTSGTYNLVTNPLGTTSGQVGILVIDQPSAKIQDIYGVDTTVTQNIAIKVDVSSSGKMSATIPAIKLIGSKYDNTDANNTVITDSKGTISGSIGE